MSKAHDLGQKGEHIAADFLAKKNHTILEKNWRWKKAEIDLITQDQNELVFVEVKTRSSQIFGQPKEFISPRKEELMKDAAETYINLKKIELEIRFDVISIIHRNCSTKIEHIQNAF